MCGWFTHLYSWGELHSLLNLTNTGEPLPAGFWDERYNVAPTQTVPIVRQNADGSRAAVPMRWGLVPSGPRTQASATVSSTLAPRRPPPSPRSAPPGRSARRIVPMSGFYEWQAVADSKTKQPWYFTSADAAVFLVAGLWEFWDKGQGPLETFTVLTGAPQRDARAHPTTGCPASCRAMGLLSGWPERRQARRSRPSRPSGYARSASRPA